MNNNMTSKFWKAIFITLFTCLVFLMVYICSITHSKEDLNVNGFVATELVKVSNMRVLYCVEDAK